MRQWFKFRFNSVVICKCCRFSTSLLDSCTWEFWMEFKKQIQGVCWTIKTNFALGVYIFFEAIFFITEDNEGIVFICFIEIISIFAKKLAQFRQAVNETASYFLLLGLKMKFFCSLTPKYLRNHLSWELSWTPSQKVFLNDAWTPSFQRTLLASKRFTIVHCRLRNMDHPSLIMLHWSNVNWYTCIHVSFVININQTHKLFTSFQKIWNNADLNEKINDLLMWVHWQTL